MHATLLTLPANDNWHGAWFWPLVPLVWLIAIVLLIRFVVWGRGAADPAAAGRTGSSASDTPAARSATTSTANA